VTFLGVKTYSYPSYIFFFFGGGARPHLPRIYTPAQQSHVHDITVFLHFFSVLSSLSVCLHSTQDSLSFSFTLHSTHLCTVQCEFMLFLHWPLNTRDEIAENAMAFYAIAFASTSKMP